MDELEQLTSEELLVLAALLRCVIRIDRQFTAPEQEAVGRVAMRVAAPPEGEDPEATTPYRESARALEPIGEERLFELIELAGEELPDDDSIREAALAVTRQEAREAIYGLVWEVAASDVAFRGESKLLDWLIGAWNLPVESPA
jgi:hypothetical protein